MLERLLCSRGRDPARVDKDCRLFSRFFIQAPASASRRGAPCDSPPTGESEITARPSAKKVQPPCRAIGEQTSRRRGLLSVEEVVSRLDRQLDGWANDFWPGPVSEAYGAVDSGAARAPWLAVSETPGE